MTDHRSLRERMTPGLPAGLVDHIDRVVTLAGQLAVAHDLDDGATARLLLTAQGHDVLRSLDDAELLRRAAEQAIELDPVERAEPVLLHGPLGATDLCDRFAVCDAWVEHAVRWHTTGHPDFDGDAWLFFLADKLEPWKVEQRPELAPLLDAAWEAPQRAALEYLALNLEHGARLGWRPHPMALRTDEALRERGFTRL
jgi:HD superfamily phosphohydrolase YqeK